MKKMLNEGNQIHNFISSSGSGTVINYGSGSDFLTSYGSGSTSQKLRFLRFRFRSTTLRKSPEFDYHTKFRPLPHFLLKNQLTDNNDWKKKKNFRV
jgi:hypothetical protein